MLGVTKKGFSLGPILICVLLYRGPPVNKTGGVNQPRPARGSTRPPSHPRGSPEHRAWPGRFLARPVRTSSPEARGWAGETEWSSLGVVCSISPRLRRWSEVGPAVSDLLCPPGRSRVGSDRLPPPRPPLRLFGEVGPPSPGSPVVAASAPTSGWWAAFKRPHRFSPTKKKRWGDVFGPSFWVYVFAPIVYFLCLPRFGLRASPRPQRL